MIFEQMNTIICDVCNKSPGIDELPITVFQNNLDIFDIAFVDFVNTCWAQGI